ncbi:hypothetical protein LQK79_15255 [Clostridium guangxiense]|nr:hypothetical protein [Clostridium guangxiense]
MDYKDGLMFMVDLFGGSYFNVASRVVDENENINII